MELIKFPSQIAPSLGSSVFVSKWTNGATTHSVIQSENPDIICDSGLPVHQWHLLKATLGSEHPLHNGYPSSCSQDPLLPSHPPHFLKYKSDSASSHLKIFPAAVRVESEFPTLVYKSLPCVSLSLPAVTPPCWSASSPQVSSHVPLFYMVFPLSWNSLPTLSSLLLGLLHPANPY